MRNPPAIKILKSSACFSSKNWKSKLGSLIAVVLAVSAAVVLFGGHTLGADTGASNATPCMAQLERFTATDVPAMGSDEIKSPAGKWTNAPAPASLPGRGLAQHPMLYIGENYTKMFLIKAGRVIWTYQTGKGYEYDDVWMLSNGNILFTRMQYVAEIAPDKQVVWRYDCDHSTGTNHTEVHTCQPIGLDKVMFILNGIPPRLMVVNIKTGAVEVNHELPYGQALNPQNIHGEFRRARFTAQGTYLVSYLSESKVVEFDKDFNQVWSYPIRSPWAALRLKNGHTLITDEHDNLTREVSQKGETIWEFNNTDLPETYRFSQAPQSCTRLANGNTIFCSRGGGGKGPQLVEVTPDKKVVWVLQDWHTLGDATAVQILDDPGIPEIPGESEH
jgi:outer membrane protein assembly factor BamB